MDQTGQASFCNEVVSTEGLPTVRAVPYEELEPRYLVYRMVASIAGTLILLSIAAIAIRLWNLWPYTWVQMLFAVSAFYLLTLNIVLIYKGIRKKAYALREMDIIYRSGLLWRQLVVIPFNRIQHCEIHQSPLERSLDLCKLRIFTAGGSSSDLVIPGLSPPRAEKLRDFITQRAAQVDEEE